MLRKLGNKIKNKKDNDNDKVRRFFEEHKLDESESLLDQRRKVFVSLIGLLRTWEACPPHKLYSAIFMLPLKRQWIYAPKKFKKELHQHTVSHNVTDSDFIQLLKCKDEQGLVFFMNDYSELQIESGEIHPFWKDLSKKLTELNDPTNNDKENETKHNALHLDVQWWDGFRSKFRASKKDVIHELYHLCMKFKPIMEILYQSNPDSLHPIKAYTEYDY